METADTGINPLPHIEWNEDGRERPHVGYRIDACVLCVAEKVRGATPLTAVAFIHGNEDKSSSCGQHGEQPYGNHYADQAPDLDPPPYSYYDS